MPIKTAEPKKCPLAFEAYNPEQGERAGRVLPERISGSSGEPSTVGVFY